MPPAVMSVNGVDLSTFGLWVEQPVGWEDAPEQRDVIVTVPGRAGGLLEPRAASIGPRPLEVSGSLIGTSAVDARTKWDAAKKHLRSPILEIEFATRPDRVGYGRLNRAPWSNVGAVTEGARFQLSFTLPNPYLQAKTVEVYTAAHGQRVPITLGTAASDVRLQLVGIGALLPQVAYLDTQGLVAGAFAFDLLSNLDVSIPLGTTEWIEVDTGSMEMAWHKADGTVVNAARYLLLTSTLFALDPNDGDATQGPVLVPSNCSMVALTRKVYG